jgi:hypothetical protein
MAKKEHVDENASVIVEQTDVEPRVAPIPSGTENNQTIFTRKETNFTNRVMERIDLHALADTLADQIAQRLFESINTSALVERILNKYGDDLQTGIIESILLNL